MLFALRACLVLAAVAASQLIPLAATVASAASGRLQFESGGQTRSAFLVERQRLKRGARPTVIILHGGSGSGLRTRRNLGLEEVILSKQIVIVYPDAVDGRWNVTDDANADVVMLRELIRKLVGDGTSDPRRIYVLGVSTGGMLAMRLACEDTAALAGAGALISAMPEPLAQTCKPSKPLPFFLLVGTADPLLPNGGGAAKLTDFKGQVASVNATVAPFKAASGCGGVVHETKFADRDPNDKTRVILDTFGDCKAILEVVRVEEGGHTLPGRPSGPDNQAAIGARNNDVDTSRLVWEFLQRAGV